MLKMIDLFAGIGGIRIAFEQNGVKCVASSEIDECAKATYIRNFKEEPLGDIRKINPDNLPEYDIIAAGFPCQPFSLGGLRRGFEDARGTMFFEVARLIKYNRPKAVFLENVEGIVNHDGRKTITTIENILSELGYNCDWRIMNACEYGVPQNRKRWYCVGFRRDMKIGFEGQEGEFDGIYKFPKKRELTVKVKDIVKNIETDKYNVSKICKRNILNFLSGFEESKRYNEGEVLLANEIRPSRCNFRCDGIAPCLTAKMGTGGNNVPVYVKQMRKLTEKECLSLMGFPDWYEIEENSMQSYKQIGNSVVVSVVSELAMEMVRVLGKRGSFMAKKAGDNGHGFQNEKNIVVSLNGKKYKELDLNMKRFVGYIVVSEGIEITPDTYIYSRLETDNKKKQDLYIIIHGNIYGISVKLGKGNSTHQEKCEDFIEYIVEEFGASKELCDDIRIMLWCDGTTDGSGKISERIDKKTYLLNYSKEIKRIRKFIKEHEKELIKRILFVGRHNSQVDYIYHGTPVDGKWISSDKLIEYQIENPQPLGTALAKVGRMNLQVWNRSLTGNSDKKRGQLQIKYPGIEADLERIMISGTEHIGTFEGNKAEFNLSRVMNQNKKSFLWESIGYKGKNKNLYVVTVSKNVFSKIANKKVKPKTDAYIIELEANEKFLLEREYILTENDINGLDYKIVENTGISIKKRDSTSFTYEKLSLKSFIRLFDGYVDNPYKIFCGLTLYQEDKNIRLNKDIVRNLGFTKEEIEEDMQLHTGIIFPSLIEKEHVKAYRDYCEYILRDVIDNNSNIKEIIFSGKGCFEAPYYVNYLYKNNKMISDVIPDKYSISNGSGRSKGKYTIIFKPIRC